MFVLELSHTAPREAVDAVLEEHVAWLDGLYEQGVFLASGPKEPRGRGGVGHGEGGG
ncbi:YciI family protein [Streptomyces sp. NPDC054808]